MIREAGFFWRGGFGLDLIERLEPFQLPSTGQGHGHASAISRESGLLSLPGDSIVFVLQKSIKLSRS
jgi:hypothetical protein